MNTLQRVQLAGPAGRIASYFCHGYRTKKPTPENKAKKSSGGLSRVARHPKPTLKGLPLPQHRSFPWGKEGLFFFFFLECMQIQTDDSWNICHSNGFCHNWAKHSNVRKHLSKIWQGFQIRLPFNPLLNKNVRSDRTLYLVNITSSNRLIFFGSSYSKVTWRNFTVIIIGTTVEGFFLKKKHTCVTK